MSLEILALTSQEIAAEESVKNGKTDNTQRFLCNYSHCGREFTSKRNLVDHHRGHHQGSKPHICTFHACGKSFLRPAHLLIHTRIHTGEKPFVCSFEGCGKRWNQKSALKQHMRSHTGEKPFECTVPGCFKRFSTSSSCKRHILTHKSSETPQPSPPGSPQSPVQKRTENGWEDQSSPRKMTVSPVSFPMDIEPTGQQARVDSMSVNFLLN